MAMHILIDGHALCHLVEYDYRSGGAAKFLAPAAKVIDLNIERAIYVSYCHDTYANKLEDMPTFYKTLAKKLQKIFPYLSIELIKGSCGKYPFKIDKPITYRIPIGGWSNVRGRAPKTIKVDSLPGSSQKLDIEKMRPKFRKSKVIDDEG